MLEGTRGDYNIFKELIGLLYEEEGILKKILEIEVQKGEDLLKGEGVEKLEIYNKELECLLEGEDELERRRLTYMGKLSVASGKEVRNFRDLENYIPNGLSEEYKEVLESLGKLVKGIRVQNETNGLILQDRLKIIDYGIKGLSEDKGLEIDYSRRGKGEKGQRCTPMVFNYSV